MHRLYWVDSDKIDPLARDFFLHALIDMGASYILYDEAGKYICITGLPQKWRNNFEEGPSDIKIFGPELAGKMADMRAKLLAPGDQDVIQHEDVDGGVYEFHCRKFQVPEKGSQFIMSISDRTAERQREKLLQTLLLEVSHRSKNMLAIVQGLASQTARYSGSLDTFLVKFRARLQALSKSQDLITDSDWRGASIVELVQTHTGHFARENPLRFETTGDDVFLPPNIAINIGLALHELAVNSISHHDLSETTGRVSIDCKRTGTPENPMIEITWVETFGKPGTGPVDQTDNGFGSIILEKVVPTAINGTAKLEVGDAVRYKLVFPFFNVN